MIKKVLFLIIFLNVIMFVLTDCCTYELTIAKIKFSGAYFEDQNKEDRFKYYSSVDTLKTKIVFMIQFDSLSFASLIKMDYCECNATKCGRKYLNTLDQSTFKLYTNKSIVVENDTIKNNENWWANTKIKRYIKFYQNVNDDYIIEFDNDFQKKSIIDNGNYTFHFECKTDDNKYFLDSTKIVISIMK